MVNYIKGINDCLSGFGLIFKSGIRRYVVIPLLINTVLFGGAIYLLYQQMDRWMEKLLPDWLAWLEWLIVPLFFLTIIVVVFFTFTLVANLIAAPFNSYLSASVEHKLTGSRPENLVSEPVWKTVVRTVGAEIRKTIYFLLWLIPLALLTIIPVINIVAPFAWFLFAAWSFSIEYTDAPLGNRGMLFKEIRNYNRSNRMRSLGLGTGVFLMTSVPVLNFLAMPVAVCAATKMTTRISDQ
ncbi:MAG: sulfate transporter CysZ [Thiotrichales bacterium]|nr:MAG: sulfate transporter CysZ [Thiotrichales bacterium]